MKKTTEVIGLPILGIKQGAEGGTVTGFVIDAGEKRVACLAAGDKKRYETVLLPVEHIIGAGKDYVITKDLANLEESTGDTCSLLGFTVVSCEGDILGTVQTFDFDEHTGIITVVDIENESFDRDKFVAISGETLFVDLAVVEETVFEEPEPEPEVEAEPEPESEPEPEPAPEPAFDEPDYSALLIGKITQSDVYDATGRLLAPAGRIIDQALIEEATATGAMMELVLSVE